MQKTEEKLKEKLTWKDPYLFLRFVIQIAASLVAIYVGGWLMTAQSIMEVYTEICAGTLKLSFFIGSTIKILLSTTVVGAIWSAGYIVAGHFKKYEDE